MAFTRRRPLDSFEASTPQLGMRVDTISAMHGGYNGYTAPNLASPQFWATASNVYSGQHGEVRRSRFGPVWNSSTSGYSAQSGRFKSLFIFGDPTPQQLLLGDVNNKQFVFNLSYPGGTKVTQRLNPYVDPSGTGDSRMACPWSRASLVNMIFEHNGQVKQKARGTLLTTIEGHGLDSPDASPGISIGSGLSATISSISRDGLGTVTVTTSAAHGFSNGQYVFIQGVTDTSFNNADGTAWGPLTVTDTTHFTFTQAGASATSSGGTAKIGITNTVGRSYSIAWENANTAHVGAPGPASQYIADSNQWNTVDAIEPGTVSTNGTTIVTGTGTAFTAAWIGRKILILDGVTGDGAWRRIVSIQSATQLTLASAYPVTHSDSNFQVYDPQATHIRLYATGDGGSIYYLLGRNAFSPNYSDLVQTGLRFVDNANSNPPNAPFSTETTQNYNLPPPIGTYLQEFQSRILIYGVPGAPATVFYTNIESTQVGQAPESCAPLNQFTLPIGSSKLFGSANLPTGLLLWSDKHDMFKVSGTLTDNTLQTGIQLGSVIQRLPYPIGSASPWACTVTYLGAMWLSSDREVWLFTDRYAPRNVGKPVQDILDQINPARLQFARATNYKTVDRNWFVLAIATGASTYNNVLLALDLDLLASNGQPSFFTFDMATNSPSWYILNVNCEAIVAGNDTNNLQRLLVSDTDLVTDADYNGTAFLGASETAPITGSITLHALGNDQPEAITRLDWLRFVTNDAPSSFVSNGWSFGLNVIDDDAYTFASPQVVTLTPGIDSPTYARALEYGPGVFRFGGVKYAIGRRFQISMTFPTAAGDWRIREIQVQRRSVTAR